MKVARFASVGVLVCASIAWSSPASAQRQRTPAPQPTPAQPAPATNEAHERFTRGHTAYQQGDYELAIQEWQAAYQLDARPLILYNLSQAYERAGLIAEAVDALERYIETAPGEDPNLDTARARLASLRARLQRTAIRIVNAPEGADIFVDEQPWGRTPRPDPIAVSPGNHRVVLRLEGYQDFSATISVPAGQAIDVSAEMGEAAGGGGGPGAVPFVMMGAGGGLVVVAAILGGVAMGKANGSDFSNGPDASSARGMAHAADAIGAIGLAAAAGGLIWWLVTREDGDDDAPASTATARITAAPFVGPGTAGATARVTF